MSFYLERRVLLGFLKGSGHQSEDVSAGSQGPHVELQAQDPPTDVFDGLWAPWGWGAGVGFIWPHSTASPKDGPGHERSTIWADPMVRETQRRLLFQAGHTPGAGGSEWLGPACHLPPPRG